MSDVELLKQHREGNAAAFGELVRRHVGWVYGVARRRVRDEQLAEDVAQAVFVLLHRKAPSFARDGAMMKWLHQAAWYASETALRTERRRKARETEAARIGWAAQDAHDREWQELEPVLDDLIEKLGRADREAVLLRYYRNLTFVEVGQQIGGTEEAARKRVNRAIQKLRRLAIGRGIDVPVVSLAIGLEGIARTAPPAALATKAAIAAAPAMLGAAAGLVNGAIFMATVAKAKIVAGVAAVLVLVFGTAYVVATHIPDGRVQRSPFTAVRWNQETPQVEVNGAWYELVAVDDQPADAILAFTKRTYGPELLQKRFDEDLVDVLGGMGHAPGATVKLSLKKRDTHEAVTLNDVAMTHENRQAIWKTRNADLLNEAPDGLVQRSPFASVRWNGQMPQVQVNQTWYELVALDDQPTAAIIAFTTKTYGKDLVEKRFDEDLLDVLTRMGRPPGKTVKLDLKKVDGAEAVTLNDVPMTHENRQQIWAQRNEAALKGAGAAGGARADVPDARQQRSPFTAIRWTDERAEVQVNGAWYELVSLNDQPEAKLVQFSKQTYGDLLWRKRIDEDLVDLMTRMGQPPGATVKLVLQPAGGGAEVTMERVEMTKEKRQMIMRQKQETQRAGM